MQISHCVDGLDRILFHLELPARVRARQEATIRIWRHALSILILPFVVVVVIPSWLLRSRAEMDIRWIESVANIGHILGSIVFLTGFSLFVWCVTLFARIGQGTLAPWDPTRRLVAVGPYRHVRNPMITAVAVMLAGEALFFWSGALVAWFVVFALVNHVYFVLSEEPGLERRFGAAYVEYKERVPRWLPRKPR